MTWGTTAAPDSAIHAAPSESLRVSPSATPPRKDSHASRPSPLRDGVPLTSWRVSARDLDTSFAVSSFGNTGANMGGSRMVDTIADMLGVAAAASAARSSNSPVPSAPVATMPASRVDASPAGTPTTSAAAERAMPSSRPGGSSSCWKPRMVCARSPNPADSICSGVNSV